MARPSLIAGSRKSGRMDGLELLAKVSPSYNLWPADWAAGQRFPRLEQPEDNLTQE